MQYLNYDMYSSKGLLGQPLGAVIHNDDGSVNATPTFYRNWLPTHNPEVGFAHYYINKDMVFRAMNPKYIAWHCGNSYGNAHYLSYEVCQSHLTAGVSDSEFLKNEEATFEQVAKDFKTYGLTPNRNTIKLHRSLSATNCPDRSWRIHIGYYATDNETNRTKLVDYFVARVKAHMSGTITSPTIDTTIKASKITSGATGQVTIKYVPGYGINVWDSPTPGIQKFTGQRLKHATNWQCFEFVDGFRRVGTNQWIDGYYTIFKQYVAKKTYNGDVSILSKPVWDMDNRKGFIKDTQRYKIQEIKQINGVTWINFGGDQWTKAEYFNIYL